MKIGLSPGFLYACYHEDVGLAEILEGVKRAHDAGFEIVDLETYDEKQFEFYTEENLKKIKEQYVALDMRTNTFTAFCARKQLASLDAEKRAEGIAIFERIVKITACLDMPKTVVLVPSAPPETVVSYMATYPGAPPEVTVIPEQYKWKDIWDYYVDTVGKCLNIATKNGLRMAIEPIPMSIISNTDSFLRLWNEINSNDLGIIFDTSHLNYQRESLPIAIEKVKDYLFGFCICDNDSIRDYHLPPGEGTINWKLILKTLKKIGYTGSVDLEINEAESPEQTYKQSQAYIQEILYSIEKEG